MIKFIDTKTIDALADDIRELYIKVFSDYENVDFLIERMREPDSKTLGKFIDGKLVAFVFGINFKKENWWAGQIKDQLPYLGFDWYEDTFELNDILVSPDHQRKGIASELLKELLKVLPYKRILLSTSIDNLKANQFYLKFGFEVLISNFKYKDFDYGASNIYIYKI